MSKTFFTQLSLALFVVWFSACEPQVDPSASAQVELQSNFPDVLNLHASPDSAFDRSPSAFSDMGSWFAYALPAKNDLTAIGSFTGPYLFTQDNGVWISRFLSQLEITVGEQTTPVDLSKAEIIENTYYPGLLRQQFRFSDPNLEVTTSLFFISSRTACIKVDLQADQDLVLQIGWRGDTYMEGVRFDEKTDGVSIHFAENEHQGHLTLPNAEGVAVQIADAAYQLRMAPISLKAQQKHSVGLYHSFCFSADEWQVEKDALPQHINELETAVDANRDRWNNWIQTTLDDIEPSLKTPSYEAIAVKSLETLTSNWRSAAGFLKHQGLFPSYHYKWFHGFWSWDSWKHAVSLARWNPALAQDQIRAMFDFQNEEGMVADCVYRDTIIENHNWRDTKPPLAAWAIWRTYEQSEDQGFLAEIYPAAKRYHEWWYAYRDYDQNGLCEYGSTDGTLIAARWESGMDNAVRFDDTRLLKSKTQAGAWSMNRESADLNAYLFADKYYLSKIAAALGKSEDADTFSSGADALKTRIQETFFSEKTDWFHDIDLETKQPILHYGAEGWIPLWAGAATDEQAERVRLNMIDTTKFATYIPFPTLAASEAGFEPVESYWRGPVWMDKAYFAIPALKQYGYEEDAQRFTMNLLDRLEGLKDSDGPIRENYNPLTGEGYESAHFSWSAAHILLLLTED